MCSRNLRNSFLWRAGTAGFAGGAGGAGFSSCGGPGPTAGGALTDTCLARWREDEEELAVLDLAFATTGL
eukprot:2315159-Alexandrium_andersonii.AAC.1